MTSNKIKIKEVEKILIFSLKNLGMAVLYPKQKLIVSNEKKEL